MSSEIKDLLKSKSDAKFPNLTNMASKTKFK